MTLWTYSLREIQRRPARAIFTLLGVALALAAVVATPLLTATIRRAYRDLFDGIYPETSLELTRAGYAGFDPAIAQSLRSVAGVRSVLPCVSGVATVVGKSLSLPVPVWGIDAEIAAVGGAWDVVEGAEITGSDGALLEASLAETFGLRPGDTVRVWSPAGPTELILSGVVRPHALASAARGVLLVPLPTAQRLFGLSGQVNSLRVLLHDGADPARIGAEMSQRLPEGLLVHASGERDEIARATLSAAEVGLTFAGIVALLAAIALVVNTCLLSFDERRPRLALLRTLGATQAQVQRLLLGEMLLLGLAGAVLGSAGGCGLAWLLLHVFERFFDMPLPRLQLDLLPFAIVFLLGPLATLAAAYFPVVQVSRHPPIEELLGKSKPRQAELTRRVGGLGFLLLAAGVLSELALSSRWIDPSIGKWLPVPTLVTVVAGCTLAVFTIFDPMIRLAGVFRLGTAGILAQRQLLRNPLRTGLTGGALFLAVMVAIGLGQTLQATLHDLQHWYRQTIVADYLIRASMPDASLLLSSALPEKLGEELTHLEGVQAVDRIAFVPARAQGEPVLVLARTFAADRPLPLALREGDPATVRAGLLRGEVVLGTSLAGKWQLHCCNTLTLDTASGPAELRVAGTAAEYAAGGQALYIEWETARQLLSLPGPHALLVQAPPAAAANLRSWCDAHHLLLQSNAQLRTVIEGLLARAGAAIWVLLTLIFLVASLVALNTSLRNANDLAPDFAVLRAIGMKRVGVIHFVMNQALILGVASVLPGSVAGIGMAYLMTQLRGYPQPPSEGFLVDPVLIGGCAAVGMILFALASAVPAWRAGRCSVAAIFRAY